MKDDTQELTLFDNYDFIGKIESLTADCESAEVEFKSARGGFRAACGKPTPLSPIRKVESSYWASKEGREILGY